MSRSEHHQSASLLSELAQSSLDSSFDHFDPNRSLDKLVDDLQTLINDKETADVVFVIGERETPFYAHKVFLWSRCLSFKKYSHQFWRSKSTQGLLTFKYSDYQPAVFARVLNYIYTGQFDFEESSVFSTLVVAQEIGLPDLQQRCESFIASRLNPRNACVFLAGAFKLESMDPNEEPVGGTFTETCVQFVLDNAAECVKTDGWCRLSQCAVKRIISSKKLCLEEEEVWRAAVRWAKFQAGVASELGPSQWTQIQKQHIATHLSSLVEHIKLLLIDSKVFAEEVEPTGVVPMEVSLERYKFAALPPDVHVQSFDDERLKPRVHMNLFKDTFILSEEKTHFQKLLNQWCGNANREWKRIFCASDDGYSAQDFHRCCDGYAPTFVLIQGEKGSICGGFSDVPWTSNTLPHGRFIPSNRAFLFTLINNQGIPASKCEVTNSRVATLHHPECGPCFGAGADLYIADNCHTGMECYSNFPHSFDGKNAASSVLMGDYYFNVVNYEVFTTKNSVNVYDFDANCIR